MQKIFIDTSAFYALRDSGDSCHTNANSFFFHLLQDINATLITSNYIIDESLTLIRVKLGHQSAIQFGTLVKESRYLQVVRVDEEVEELAWQIFQKYSDKDYSFTDCTSFTLMETLGISDVFAFDKHFQQHGFILCPQ